MKNRKLFVLAALAIALMMLCAFACADAVNGEASANLQPSAYRISLYRGQTVKLLIWGNFDSSMGGTSVNSTFSSDIYNITSGADYGGSTYTSYGSTKVKVKSGSSWLKLNGTVNSWTFNTKSNNTSTKARTGKIVVTDRYGTVATYQITQLPLAKMSSGSHTSTKITLKAKKLSGVSGYAFYKDYWSSYYSSLSTNSYFTLIKTSSSYKITAARPSNAYRYYYWYFKVRPLKVLNNGRLVYGPFSTNFLWDYN